MSPSRTNNAAARCESTQVHGFDRGIGWNRQHLAMLLLAAIWALCLGLLVYLADRRADTAWSSLRSLALDTGPLFGVMAQRLPSFVHPFAFSLLSAAVVHRPYASASVCYSICALWWVVNLAFEIGQHPRFSTPIAESLQIGLGRNALTETVSRYFLRGHFDWGDITALSIGALASAAILWLLQASEDRHDS